MELVRIRFATIFTPQGDGNLGIDSRVVVQVKIRHDIYPARGRKLRRHCNHLILSVKFATIFTPQGDGNRGNF